MPQHHDPSRSGDERPTEALSPIRGWKRLPWLIVIGGFLATVTILEVAELVARQMDGNIFALYAEQEKVAPRGTEQANIFLWKHREQVFRGEGTVIEYQRPSDQFRLIKLRPTHGEELFFYFSLPTLAQEYPETIHEGDRIAVRCVLQAQSPFGWLPHIISIEKQ